MRLRIQVLDVERAGVRLVVFYPDRRAETVVVPVGDSVAFNFAVTQDGGIAFAYGDLPDGRLTVVRSDDANP